MKKYSLLPLLAITLISLNAHALTGHGFKVLSETIETSPGAVGGFKSDAGSQINPEFVFAWAGAIDGVGDAGQNAMVTGVHSVAISNGTKQDQIYTYKYELNCDGQYFRKTDRILVHPGGFAKDKGHSFLTTYHSKAGVYRINAVTDVIGESSDSFVGVGALKVMG